MRQSSWWNAMAPASPRQASSCRPGERLWRSQALRPSARVTSRMKASSRVTTSPPANMRRESSSCWPSPPAPTKPMMTEARRAHSQR
ncbi:hypothetical protein D3C73_1273420 [compost metagenome]